MRMALIQPFINAADAVLAEMLQGPAHMSDVKMEGQVYRRQGIAATVSIRGDLVGRIVFDLDSETALRVAAALAGTANAPAPDAAQETVCELANIVVGNAVTLLNDQGFSFKVSPPVLHTSETGFGGDTRTEALVMRFETAHGPVFMNIALDYGDPAAKHLAEASA